MLKDRLKTAAVLISVVVLLTWLDVTHPLRGVEGVWLIPLLLFFSLGTAWDMLGLLRRCGPQISAAPVLCGTALVTLSAAVPLAWPLFGETYPTNCPIGRLGWMVIAGVATVFLVLGAEMWRYGKGESSAAGQTIARTSGAVFVSLYVGLPMGLLVVLRSLGSGNWGMMALLTMIAVTKSADSGAYFAGKSFGKHKLVPRLSPGKTWEGLFGGIAAATLAAYGCLHWLFPLLEPTAGPPLATPAVAWLAQPIWGALVLGLLLTIAGLIGDLAESLVKRDAGAKDSGTWLPGMGGVWDVTDSLIASVMPALMCFAAGVAG